MAAGVPDVLSAFLIELNENVVIQKKTFAFLRGFNHHRAGTFVRGTGVDLENGRYAAPYTAIYRFQSTLNIARPFKIASMKPHNAITARICINGACEENLSLKFRSGISTNSKIFTISVSGNLYLQKNQYVEVVVENTASNRITILSDSTFSGCLVGA
ncbi:adipolin-like [Hydractinia symbiolongicarpus]|uniref:adipolin-like n=1 Tax=Hydractinia symbiolongicarpus TaxID=13093 RepID=UPI00254C1DB8|nr:adipolin-like [Hydractinia symbiolongicarpus]